MHRMYKCVSGLNADDMPSLNLNFKKNVAASRLLVDGKTAKHKRACSADQSLLFGLLGRWQRCVPHSNEYVALRSPRADLEEVLYWIHIPWYKPFEQPTAIYRRRDCLLSNQSSCTVCIKHDATRDL
jgi:hypothetical protein